MYAQYKAYTMDIDIVQINKYVYIYTLYLIMSIYICMYIYIYICVCIYCGPKSPVLDHQPRSRPQLQSPAETQGPEAKAINYTKEYAFSFSLSLCKCVSIYTPNLRYIPSILRAYIHRTNSITCTVHNGLIHGGFRGPQAAGHGARSRGNKPTAPQRQCQQQHSSSNSSNSNSLIW